MPSLPYPITVAILIAVLASHVPCQDAEVRAALQALTAETPADRLAALQRLGSARPEPRVTEAVALALGDKELAVRRAAVDSLLALRPDLADRRETLVEITAEPDEEKWNSAIGLGGGAGGFFVGPAKVAAGLSSEDPQVRRDAVVRLCGMGRSAASYQDELLELLQRDPDAGVRAAVAKHVTQLGWNDGARAGLLQALKDPSTPVRKEAAVSLGGDRNDPGIVAALRGAVQDPELDVRVAVVVAIGHCGTAGRAAANDILATLRDREARVRVAALESARLLKLQQPRAVTEVSRCLGDTDTKVLVAALQATTGMRQLASGSTARTLELTRHEAADVRKMALTAARHIALQDRCGAVALSLVEALTDPDDGVAHWARIYLEQLVTGDWGRGD